MVLGAAWVFGWLIAGMAYETRIHARYDLVLGKKFANFAGFDIYTCPKGSDDRFLEIQTNTGHRVGVTLCVAGSSMNVPDGFALESFYPDGYLERKSVEVDGHTDADSIKIFFTDGTSHIYENVYGEVTEEIVLQRIRKDFPNKNVVKIVGNGIHWIDYESLKSIFGREVSVDEKKKIALANALSRLQEKSSLGKSDSLDNPFDIFDDDKVRSAFKIRNEDEMRLNEKWWGEWRSVYGQGLAIMIGGLFALWVFTLSVGWIFRGFMGIPRGMDSKP